MSASHPQAMLVFSAVSGIATHLTIFRYGEWDVQAPKLVLSYLFLLLGAMVLDSATKANYIDFAAPYPWLLKGVWCHILGIYGSMIIYRAFFHRLSQFPGPFFARLSNFYVTSLSARKLHLYEETEKLHKIYGDYVRLGLDSLPFIHCECDQIDFPVRPDRAVYCRSKCSQGSLQFSSKGLEGAMVYNFGATCLSPNGQR